MESSLHLNAKIRAENYHKGYKKKQRYSAQCDKRPKIVLVPEDKAHTRGDYREEYQQNQGEHIVLLCFKIREEEYRAECKSAEANDRNNENCPARS
jgi:hypothetical protein